MVVALEEVKLYLRIDSDEEDILITKFVQAAEEICEEVLRIKLKDFEVIPETIKQIILYIVSNMHEKREELNLIELLDFVSRIGFAYREFKC